VAFAADIIFFVVLILIYQLLFGVFLFSTCFVVLV
jgi:hypothetical protein